MADMWIARDQLEKVLSGGKTQRYGDQQRLFFQGDAREHIYFVESGMVCLYRTLGNGARQIFEFRVREEIAGLGAGPHHTLSAKALGITVLKSFPTRSVFDAASRDPALALDLYAAVSRELEATRDHLLAVCQKAAVELVAYFIADLASRQGVRTDGEVLNLPMSRWEIADLLGIKMETVSRALAKLCRLSLIELIGRTGLKIRDVFQLRKLAGMDPTGALPGLAAINH